MLQRLRAWANPRPIPPPISVLPLLEGVAASATSIGGRLVQQDAHIHAFLPGAKVIILADGIGQYEGSGLISARAVLTAIEYLNHLTSQGGRINEEALRQTMAMASSAAISLNGELAAQRSSGGGTTLLIGIETADYFYVGAAGDGAVVFINGQSKTVRNALISEPGRRIRGYIGAPGALPTILSYPKLNPDGHALFLATDGMATSLRNSDSHRPADMVQETTTIALILREIREGLEQEDWQPRVVDQLLLPWVDGEHREVMSPDGSPWQVTYAQDNRSIGVLLDEQFIQATQCH